MTDDQTRWNLADGTEGCRLVPWHAEALEVLPITIKIEGITIV